jgi:hypothetical protein
MVARIFRIQPPPDFIVNAILIVTVVSKYFKLWHIFEEFISYICMIIFPCSLVMRCEHIQYLVSAVFTSRPVSVLALDRPPGYSLYVCTQQITIIGTVVKLMYLIHFQSVFVFWILLIAHSKAKLEEEAIKHLLVSDRSE